MALEQLPPVGTGRVTGGRPARLWGIRGERRVTRAFEVAHPLLEFRSASRTYFRITDISGLTSHRGPFVVTDCHPTPGRASVVSARGTPWRPCHRQIGLT